MTAKEEEIYNIADIFGEDVFDDSVMRERLPKLTYETLKKTIDTGSELDLDTADVIAQQMKEWAIEKGATHYTHWFQPLTGHTAEKHDSFISKPNPDGRVLMEFSGKNLIKGEPDASSFPSGGLRATFEARGYTAWDCTSPAFVRKDAAGAILCIPTAFCAYGGEALDQKTPLLRSMEAIDKEGVRLLRLLGRDVKHVIPQAGAEQEYFLINRERNYQRDDLIYAGRTLFGAMPPKGQELDDHYFGALKQKVGAFMRDVNEQLWKLGVSSKTQHNEVAPAQHELAPIYSNANIALDHNHIIMQTLKKTAMYHGMTCLLHEKPFAGVNGSGKHINWNLETDTGFNLMKPGKTPHENTQFLLVLMCVLKAVDRHADLLRESAADPGNDLRLGASEAPPAIISVYLGEQLEDVIEQLVQKGEATHSIGKSKLMTGVSTLPELNKDATDRNRTSPFAFTGNRFEFRMVGSRDSISAPCVILNTIVAEELSEFYEEMKASSDIESTVKEIVRKTLTEHKNIIFNGDNYSDEWVAEAEKRGLCNYRSLPEAMQHYVDRKNIDLFEKNGILNEAEIRARYEIELEHYSKQIRIEALTMVDMAEKNIAPAVISFVKEMTDAALAKKQLLPGASVFAETQLVEELSNELEAFVKKTAELKEAAAGVKAISDSLEQATYCRERVFVLMNELRALGDSMEQKTSAKYWPYPSYGELLFGV